ncbi:hypothetical protein HDU99_009206, partial [Rhizoclosmatium hyalinum]
MGLVTSSASGGDVQVVAGGSSFVVQVVYGGVEQDDVKSLFPCELTVVAVKAGTTGVSRDCNGI